MIYIKKKYFLKYYFHLINTLKIKTSWEPNMESLLQALFFIQMSFFPGGYKVITVKQYNCIVLESII